MCAVTAYYSGLCLQVGTQADFTAVMASLWLLGVCAEVIPFIYRAHGKIDSTFALLHELYISYALVFPIKR